MKGHSTFDISIETDKKFGVSERRGLKKQTPQTYGRTSETLRP